MYVPPQQKDLTLYSPNFLATDISVRFHEKRKFKITKKKKFSMQTL